MPKLLVTLPDGSEVTHELTEDLVTVGRVSDNTIQIEDASVSSHHAELTLRGVDYVLKGYRLHQRHPVERSAGPAG